MHAQPLDIGDQMPGGVGGGLAQWSRPARAALVEQHHAEGGGIEEAAMHRARARPGAAVQEQHRPAARVADLLEIDGVALIDLKIAAVIGRDLGPQVGAMDSVLGHAATRRDPRTAAIGRA